MEIVEYDGTTGAPLRLNGEYQRDEAGQAAYLSEFLEIFDRAARRPHRGEAPPARGEWAGGDR